MDNNLIDKIYDFVNHIIHLNNSGCVISNTESNSSIKKCPITQLDISMQPENSKFISSSGVKWYFENRRNIFNKLLLPSLTENFRDKDLSIQFKVISHNIRNKDSNPRNNARKAIQKRLDEKDCLFNNLLLIDKSKLRQANLNQ
jgi:hypothetical protein